MRKLIMASLFLLAIAAVQAQPERIGAGLTFATKKNFNGGITGNPGINIKTWIPLDKRLVFHVAPSLTGFNVITNNPATGVNVRNYMFYGDLDFQVRLYHERTLKLVAVAGANFTYILSQMSLAELATLPPDFAVQEEASAMGVGPVIGAALEMRMSAQWDFILTGKYRFSVWSVENPPQVAPLLPVNFSAPIIQVHGVYYFKSRGRGYSRR